MNAKAQIVSGGGICMYYVLNKNLKWSHNRTRAAEITTRVGILHAPDTAY